MIADVSIVTVDAIDGYRTGGLRELLNVAGKGAATIGGGLAGWAAAARALQNTQYPVARFIGLVLGRFVGTELGGAIFDALTRDSDCPGPLVAGYWTRPECSGLPPPG